MILQAQNELTLDFARSILVGDKVSDIQAGNAASVGSNQLFAAKRPIDLASLNYELIATLQEAIPYLQRVRQ